VHKLCNERFATLLGYPSAAAWAAVSEPFPMIFVAPESRETLIAAYQAAMEHLVGTSNRVTWRTKGGGTVETNVILVPFTLGGYLCALHFVEPR